MNKYNHWIGQLFGKIFGKDDEAYAVTLFANTYYSCLPGQVSVKWRRHENCHQAQQRADGTLVFVLVYVWQWVTRGYQNISYEQEARAAELS